MSVEAVLTVITVVLAVLAVIPPERGQDLRIRLGGGSTVLVGGVAAALVLYWALLEQIHSLPGLRALDRSVPWVGNWTPASSSLLVLLLATGFASWSYRRTLPIHRLPRLGVAISDLLARRRFGECLHLLETHFESLKSALHGEYWEARARTNFLPTPGERLIAAQRRVRSTEHANAADTAGDEVDALGLLTNQGGANIRLLFPTPPKPNAIARRLAAWAETPREAAEDIARTITFASPLVDEIAAANPYLGLRLLQLRSTWLHREFAETYARALLTDPASVLYHELRRAQNIDANGLVFVNAREQPLIAALCTDAVRPEGPLILYTFLDLGIEPLWWGRATSVKHILNAPIADYYERGRWTSPPFATIYLLDIVAPRVAVDPQASLINLYVLRTLVNAILRQIKPDADVDLAREWPTPSHYLLYETVSLLRDIVGILQTRPEALQPVLEAQAKYPEPKTLPEHAIDVLGSVMYECLRSDRLDGRFKGYLLEVWWQAYSDKYKGGWSRSGDVLDALARGGSPGKGDMAHREGLADAFEHIDFVLKVSDAAGDLRARFELST